MFSFLRSLNSKIVIYGSLIAASWLLLYLLKFIPSFIPVSYYLVVREATFLSATAILLLATFFYYRAYKNTPGQGNKIPVFVFFVIFNLLLFFLAPIMTSDIDCYIAQGRVLSEYGANPLTTSYNNFPNDILYSDLTGRCMWTSEPSPYGPIFVYISSGLSFLSDSDLSLTYILFKILFFILHAFIFLLLLKKFSDPRIALLYGWNPLINFEFITNVHNDVILIFFLAIALIFYLNAKQRCSYYVLAWIFILLASLVKFIPVLFLPFLFIMAVKDLSRLHLYKFIFSAFFFSLLIPILFYLPLYDGLNTFGYTTSYALVRYKSLINSPFIILFCMALSSLGIKNIITIAFAVSKILFIIFYFLQNIFMLKNWPTLVKSDLIKYSLIALIVFYFTFANTVFPWYYSGILFLLIFYLAATSKFEYAKYVFIITLYAILNYIMIR